VACSFSGAQALAPAASGEPSGGGGGGGGVGSSAATSSSLVALDGDAAMHLKQLQTKRDPTTKIKALQVPRPLLLLKPWRVHMSTRWPFLYADRTWRLHIYRLNGHYHCARPSSHPE
jgi:hypothetical protein